MTLRETLTEHYITHPEQIATGFLVTVDTYVTRDWDREVKAGEVIEVIWEGRIHTRWTIGEEP